MPASSIVVFFDLETSGRFPDQHEIIQIAAVAMRGAATVGEFEVKLQFDMERAEPEALAMNSYDEVEWQSALRPQDALRRFADFLSQHATQEKMSRRTGKPYYVAKLAGHNAGDFDMPFLNTAFKRFNLFLPADWRVLDTLDMADWLSFNGRIDPPNLKLTTLCEYFGQPLLDAHDALADVRGTAYIALQMLALLGITPPSPERAPEPEPELEPEPPVEPAVPEPVVEPDAPMTEPIAEATVPEPEPETTPDDYQPPPLPGEDDDDRQLLLF